MEGLSKEKHSKCSVKDKKAASADIQAEGVLSVTGSKEVSI